MNLSIDPGFSNMRAGSDRELRQRLCVIIVTWNVCDFLRGCLESLLSSGVSKWAEVIIVDNASSDDTVDMVSREFPWVRVIETGSNLGFSRANNRAICETNSEYVLLLNPDTVAYPGALERLVERADADAGVAVVGPKHVGRSGATCYEGAVALPTIWNVCCDFFKVARLFPKSRIWNGRLMGYWDHESDREVPGIPGTAMLLRRVALEQVGLLDEHMHYAEDMDLCLRMRTYGWKAQYVASSVILHYGGESIKRAGNYPMHLQIAFHSFWLFLCKHYGRLTAMRLSCVVLFWSIALICVALPMSVVPRLRGRAAHLLGVGTAMLRWSIARKLRFKHDLAAPARTLQQVRSA